MYNFLEPLLLPKVTTKSSAIDRYEVENLLSSDFLIKSRGFIAYTTTKPPIEIDFQLICNINLSYIVISTKIGSHQCSGVEVLVRNANTEFVPICKAIYEADGVIFCNSRYYSKNKPPTTSYKGYHLAYFRSDEFRSFINADTVRIRILRTRKGTIPCLAAVEIWGTVSKWCSQETTQTIHKLLNRRNKSAHTNHVTDINEINTNIFEIPDDFKDALTYELMAIPMTLPSGHTVDQSTLEKCLATDASYGRHGCDPFTGLRYTDDRRPILNVALKTRIDMFLLRNSHLPEICSAKRTLGRSSDLYSTAPVLKVNNTEENYSDITHISKKIKINSCDSGSDNLEEAVNKVLNNKDFVRFTSISPGEKETPRVISCVVCGQIEQLYVLPCKHLYCRSCSLNMADNTKCKLCDAEFFKRDLQRYHT